jgi:hypothetical protein
MLNSIGATLQKLDRPEEAIGRPEERVKHDHSAQERVGMTVVWSADGNVSENRENLG